jgi:hypothetical protein
MLLTPEHLHLLLQNLSGVVNTVKLHMVSERDSIERDIRFSKYSGKYSLSGFFGTMVKFNQPSDKELFDKDVEDELLINTDYRKLVKV